MHPTKGTDPRFHNPEPTPCCTKLRCKSMMYSGKERPGLLTWSNTQTHWCLDTGTQLGPDDKAALHPKCQPGRECYTRSRSIGT